MADWVYGKPVVIAPGVARLTASNPSPMTGPGTNTYLVGQQRFAVIDPGPLDETHVQAILAATGGAIDAVFCTHTHPDHSPAAQRLRELCGAPLIGLALQPDDGYQDTTFLPDLVPEDGQVFATEAGELIALATPGHVDNHFCFFLPSAGMLFAGDHIMQGSTVVIIPPHGKMGAYLRSLQRLLEYPLQAIAPAHGHVIADPMAEVERLIQHRLVREDKVINALQPLGCATLDALLPLVYDDVPQSLWTMAHYSLLAHLLKLEEDQRVQQRASDWLWLS